MIGQTLGPYQILAELGRGGMGEVYRARDTKLDRDVAIKVLPESFAADADRVARFTREAKTLASLNHPNIAGIYGIEEFREKTSGVFSGSALSEKTPDVFSRALVMELVEGQDLSEMIGGLEVQAALQIARQIIDALEAAHEQGIIHRDLKPQNIKVRDDGTVKVLDFGLAKAMDSGTSGPGTQDAANSPTLTARATQMGMILGTAAYMSPEQARGRPVDKRTDVWAFGCVLFEMLSGRKAFDGEDVTEMISAVMKTEPDWTALPADLPANIRTILTRCLVKDRKARIPDFSVVRYMLDQPASAAISAAGAAPTATARSRWSLPLLVACGALVVATVALAAMHFGETPPAPPPEMRVDITTPSTPWVSDFELSPDGSSIAFVAPKENGALHLWLRRLDQASPQMLSGTEEARQPFWSPDSKSIGYFAGGSIRRIDADGGTSTRVTQFAGASNGGAWGQDDVILFRTGSGLMRVSAGGGQAEMVTKGVLGLAPQAPQFLPDGRTFLYYQYTGISETSGLYLASLDGSSTFLASAESTGRWLPPSSLAYVSQGRLVVRPIDLVKREFTGPPQALADGQGSTYGHGGFSISRDGLIAYRPESERPGAHLAWFDSKGTPVGTPIDLAGPVASLAFSPDGTRLAVDATINNNRDVWISDLARGGLTRLTFHSAVDGFPAWLPDSRTVVFESGRKDGFDIYAKAANGAGAEEAWLEREGNQWPHAVSPDGKWLVYFDAENAGDLMALPLPIADPRAAVPVATTPFSENQAVLSPDGKWVAYRTNESGRDEVVVQAFPTASGKWQVSANGGQSPQWGPGGRELYFISGSAMMAATVRAAAGGSFDFAPPVKLFDVQIVPSNSRAQYAVDRRGRFLINTARAQNAGVTAPITLLLNWRGGAR